MCFLKLSFPAPLSLYSSFMLCLNIGYGFSVSGTYFVNRFPLTLNKKKVPSDNYMNHLLNYLRKTSEEKKKEKKKCPYVQWNFLASNVLLAVQYMIIILVLIIESFRILGKLKKHKSFLKIVDG